MHSNCWASSHTLKLSLGTYYNWFEVVLNIGLDLLLFVFPFSNYLPFFDTFLHAITDTKKGKKIEIVL